LKVSSVLLTFFIPVLIHKKNWGKFNTKVPNLPKI